MVPQSGKKRDLFLEILEEARLEALREYEGKTVTYVCQNNEWRKFGQPKRKRPLDSVVLAKGVAEGILADVKRFMGRAQWYKQRGVPYRRGYLLHGPPGNNR